MKILCSPVDQVTEALLDADADLRQAPGDQDVAHVPGVSHLSPQVTVCHATGIVMRPRGDTIQRGFLLKTKSLTSS